MNITTQLKGMDISTLLEEEAAGAHYFDNGQKMDLFDILQKYGVNSIRLRIWNDPYSINGQRYGAGTNDLVKTIALSKRARAHGMSVLLDFHYSDFWADPGKQFPPKAWADYSEDELVTAVYSYTKETLLALQAENVLPEFVQVGNEITNGCLWPLGNRHFNRPDNYSGTVPYFNPVLRSILGSGIKAVREVSKDITVMLHLDNGGNNELYRDWFDGYFGFDRNISACLSEQTAVNPAGAADFDVIGLSYYPFWHGSFSDLSRNMNDIATRYGKELVIAEVSMGFSMQDYRNYEAVPADSLKGMATKQELVDRLNYPMTPEGQLAFMQDLLKVIAHVPNLLGRGYYYWEPAWIPVPGVGWATEASLEYIHDKGPCGNEWANQALFDYEGNSLPALRL